MWRISMYQFFAFGNVMRDAGGKEILLEYMFAFRSVVWYDIKDKVRGTVLKEKC